MLRLKPILLPIAAAFGLLPRLSLTAWLSLPIAIRAASVVLTQKGGALNAALAATGQAALAFSLLFWVGLMLARVV